MIARHEPVRRWCPLYAALALGAILPCTVQGQDVSGPDRHGLAFEVSGGPAVGTCNSEEPLRCDDLFWGVTGRAALVWWRWGRVAVEGAADAAWVEYPDEYRNPILVTLGARVYLGYERRLYLRFGVGKGWFERPEQEGWSSHTHGGPSFGVGYSWPVADRFDLGVYASLWTVVSGGTEPIAAVPAAFTVNVPF